MAEYVTDLNKISFCTRINVVVMGRILSRILGLTELIESEAASKTRFILCIVGMAEYIADSIGLVST